MPVSSLVRSFRHGELVVRDGASQSLTVLLDGGRLAWTERTHTVEIKDRGSLADGHLRKGADEPVTLSFAAAWTQLVGRSADPADPLQLYEFLTFAPGTNVTSTSAPGEQQTLQFEFTIHDPAGIAGEKVVFAKVYRESLTLSEGEESRITFTGRDFETAPTVSRL